MDLETMTVDELDAASVKLKAKINVLRDERHVLKEVRDRKVTLEALATKLGVDVSGITPEQAQTLLEIARTPKPGDVVVTPGTGHMDLGLSAPDVGGQE